MLHKDAGRRLFHCFSFRFNDAAAWYNPIMGIKIFRDDNWNNIKNGVIFRRDIRGLDGEKDRELIRYLLLRAPLRRGRSMLRYAGKKYGMNEMPEPRRNIDDPDDARYEAYFVLREQVGREEDPEILKEAAFHSSDHDMAAFAFCRLTGYSFSPDDCDAYSYRTFSCGVMPGMTEEDIQEFYRVMIEKEGPFKDAAEECLRGFSAGEAEDTAESGSVSVPLYDKAKRDHMRQLLKKASPIIDLIASDQIPLGSYASAEVIDSLAAGLGFENEQQMDEDEMEELAGDRQVLINLYGGTRKRPAISEWYAEFGRLLRKYGLFDEEVVLLENALVECDFSGRHLKNVKDRLETARKYREADDAAMTDSERTAEELRRALRKEPPDEAVIGPLLEQCGDDAVLYDIARGAGRDPKMYSIRKRAACLIRSRDYQYAFSSYLQYDARISMILNLFESLEGDDLFLARTILTDPFDPDKLHMLLYCRDEALLMLGWLYVRDARRTCGDRLRDMGSRFPEAYGEMNPPEKARCVKEWLAHAAKLALEILSEDEAVRRRISGPASVDSDPLHFFLSTHHPDPDVRLRHAMELRNPARIAYAGSWTSDDRIKEALSVRINNTRLITEMIFGDLSGMDLVFGFRKPEDLTLQDRFLAEIMKNHPDPEIREHVRTELLRGKVEIPGVDLTKPDSLYNK